MNLRSVRNVIESFQLEENYCENRIKVNKNMGYSTTQASNLTAMIGVVMLVLNVFKIQIAQEELQNLLGGVLAISGI